MKKRFLFGLVLVSLFLIVFFSSFTNADCTLNPMISNQIAGQGGFCSGGSFSIGSNTFYCESGVQGDCTTWINAGAPCEWIPSSAINCEQNTNPYSCQSAFPNFYNYYDGGGMHACNWKTNSNPSVRCYYDGDSDLYGNYSVMQLFPTTACGGFSNWICNPEALNQEGCTMLGFDCDDSNPSFGESCSGTYCYKDSDKDNYVIHSDFYIIHPKDGFYSKTGVCKPGYTSNENIASNEDDCNDSNPNIHSGCKINFFKYLIKKLL